jgi:lipid II:glycine glycyltransferase (peptidoglycan interpeptide bridge formation enzyme)
MLNLSTKSEPGINDESISLIKNSRFGAPLIYNFEKKLYSIKIYSNNQLVGLIILRFITDKYFIKTAVIDMGPIIDAKNENDCFFIKTRLYDVLYEEIKNHNIFYVHFSHWSREVAKEFFSQFNIVKKYATFIVDLDKSENELFGNLKSGQKNMIRKGQKKNVKVLHYSGNDLVDKINDFAELMKMTQNKAVLQNKNTSMLVKSSNYIRNILANEASFLSLAFKDKTLVAGALVLYSGQTLYYYLGASDLKLNRETAAADLLHWEIIKYGKTLGARYYDLGGVPVNPTKDHPAYGVYKFKAKFAGTYSEYYGGIYAKNIIYKFIFNTIMENKFIKRTLHKLLLKQKIIDT